MTQPTNDLLNANLSLEDVSETGLLTLYCRAAESRSANPILKDPQAEAIAAALAPLLRQSDRKILKMLGQGRLKPKLVVHIALRAQKFDEITRAFLQRYPDGVVVSLGCGMDTRFSRIDNAKVHFFDLDLPEVIGMRRRFFQESERYQMIASSVLDPTWMDQVLQAGPRPVLFLAEGLFMYLPPAGVKELVVTLQKRFPNAELLAEFSHQRWVEGIGGAIARRKLQRELAFGSDARFLFGIQDSRDVERWNPGIEFLSEWSYFDTDHPKLGWERGPGKWDFFRKVQWTAHYRLNGENHTHL